MTAMPETILALAWSSFLWNFGAATVFFLAAVLVLVILIQDSKDGGLGGAFGGGGGDSLLGAKAQQGITRFTSILGIVLAVLLLCLGKFDPHIGPQKHPGDPDDGQVMQPIGGDTPDDPASANGEEGTIPAGRDSEKDGTPDSAQNDGGGESTGE